MLVARSGRRAAATARGPALLWRRVSKLSQHTKELLVSPKRLPLQNWALCGSSASSTAMPGGTAGLFPVFRLHNRFFSGTGSHLSDRRDRAAEGRARALVLQTRLNAAPSDSPVMMEVFADIEKAGGLGLSKAVSSRLMIALVRQNCLDECLRVFELSWERGLHPSTAAYAIALKAFARAERNEDALRMFGAMRYNDSVREKWTYATALVAATKLQRQELVLQICNEMRQSEMDASEACWLMFGAACKSNQHDLVLKTLEYIRENGMNAGTAYTSAFGAAAKVEQHEFVVEIFRHMKRHGVATTRANWYVVLRSCSHVGADAVMEVFADINKDGDVQLSASAASMLIGTLAKQKRLDECLRALNYSWELGTPLNSTAYSMALDGFSKAERLENTLQVFHAMRNGAGIDEKGKWMYKTALLAATKLKRNELVFEIFNCMKENSVDVTDVYEHVLGAACKSKQRDLMFEILDHMHENGMDMATAYTSMIGTAENSGQHEFVAEIFRYMRRHGAIPTGKNWHTVLKSGSQVDVDAAMEVFADIEKDGDAKVPRNVALTMIGTLAKRKRLGECLRVLNYSWDQGIRLNAAVYATAIYEFSKAEQFENTLQVFDGMCKDGCINEQEQWVYKTALLAAAKLKRNERVIEILTYMKGNNVDTAGVYVYILGTACKSQQHNLVLEILDYMHENGLDTASAYASTIGAATKSEQHTFVLGVFQHMQENGVAPTSKNYDSVLYSCARVGDVALAQEICGTMRQRGLNITASGFKSLLYCAAKTGRWEVAAGAVANLETAGSSSRSRDVISKLVTRLAKEKRLDECWRVLESCWERDLSLTRDAYAAAFNNLSKTDQFERVLRVFDAMRTEGAITKTWTYTTALLAAMNLKRNELVFQIFKCMKDNNVDATDAYLDVLEAACKSNQHDLVLKTFDHMSKDGLNTAHAYKSIIGKTTSSTEHDFVFELLHRMIENRVNPAAEYSHVLRTACESKQHEFVVEIFQHMQQNGVEPTSDNCKIALQSCDLVGDDELKKHIKNLLLQRILTTKGAVRLRG